MFKRTLLSHGLAKIVAMLLLTSMIVTGCTNVQTPPSAKTPAATGTATTPVTQHPATTSTPATVAVPSQTKTTAAPTPSPAPVKTTTPAITITSGPSPATSPTPVPTASSSKSLSYVIVDTGQDTCYNNSGPIAAPSPGQAFYGQDAQFSGVQPAYRDNGDGTVTDLNTGLMWQKDPGAKVTYQQAVANAASLRVGGYDDWRLPTIKELYSLILFTGVDPSDQDTPKKVPFIDTRYFDFQYGDVSTGVRIMDSQYWSSTQYVSTTMNGAPTVFGVNFADGRIKGYPMGNGRLGTVDEHYAMYVRGNPDYGKNDFVDNGDGTITDKATGLMWSQTDSGQGLNWQQALAWVQQKNQENYLGHNDWRLPNAKELQSIVDYNRSPATTHSAAIDPLFKTTRITDERGQPDYPFFWTSTTHMNAIIGGTEAAYIAFGEALGYMNGVWMDVHGAGAQRTDPKAGNPSKFPQGRGPQGDAIRIYNYVRLVRNAN